LPIIITAASIEISGFGQEERVMLTSNDLDQIHSFKKVNHDCDALMLSVSNT
jgi:hypothetical protein